MSNGKVLQVFKPQPLSPETAHTSQPILTTPAEGKPAKRKAKLSKQRIKNELLVVPSMLRVVSEIKTIGAGLVADIRLRHSLEP